MSPNPRSRIKYGEDGSGRGLRGRLNLLLILMSVQVVLMAAIWLNLSDLKPTAHQSGQANEPVIKVKESSSPSSKLTDTQKPERIEDFQPLQEVESEQPVETVMPSPIRVQVLNGGAKGGLAGLTGKWLKKNGYAVKDIGNADRGDYRFSQVIDRSGNLTAARELASLLGIKEAQIKRLKLMPEPKFDLTLILGRDYRRLSIGR